jgi:hypothetical protein
MGSLNRFDLSRIIKEYNTPNMFETGTFWGDGVAHALHLPFSNIISVEIIPAIAAKARCRFAANEKVKIMETDSISALERQLPKLEGNTVFWLDAHFPGADAGLTDHADGTDELFRLPLIKETELISKFRKKFHDVLILDDLRIYEDGPYQNGPVPSNAIPKGGRSLSFVYQYFEATHYIFKSYLDEGYTLLFPKKNYNRNHFKLSDLFKKKHFVEDLYLLS